MVAVDRFDAGYIDDGGREFFHRNLRIAGLSERVEIKTADLTMFAEGRACLDLVQQLHAVEKAVGNAKCELIHGHIEHCPAGDEIDSKAALHEF